MHHFSPEHRADTVSHSRTCRGAFTASCGAGYKKFENPQVELLLSVHASVAAQTAELLLLTSSSSASHQRIESGLNAAFGAARVTFELRRFLPPASRHHASDALGFCIVRTTDGSSGSGSKAHHYHHAGSRLNTRIADQLQGEVVAQSAFKPSDCVTVTFHVIIDSCSCFIKARDHGLCVQHGRVNQTSSLASLRSCCHVHLSIRTQPIKLESWISEATVHIIYVYFMWRSLLRELAASASVWKRHSTLCSR